jgi:hypothetical protein
MLFWAQAASIKPLWAIVPDVPGNADATMIRWNRYANAVAASKIPLAVAVQNGMTPEMVRSMDPQPDVIAVGGTTEWKWETARNWCEEFKRVHVLRCNSPEKLYWLESIGCESTDGTGWNRGDKKQTEGLEEWARREPAATTQRLWPYTCKTPKSDQMIFA